VIEFLEAHFSSSDPGLEQAQRETAFLDLGTGNGELLFGLRDAGWRGRMLGVDYSERSVEFARRIAEERVLRSGGGGSGAAPDTTGDAGEEHDENTAQEDKQTEETEETETERETPPEFVLHDIISHPATNLLTGREERGWDVVLDKGTFDAISLSSALDDRGRRINEGYRDRALRLVRDGGLCLITSCNWTEEELEKWFVRDGAGGDGDTDEDGFEKVARIQYRSFSFGGIKGQTISSVCFRKVGRS
jgi:SAM-dependent methyltransferase